MARRFARANTWRLQTALAFALAALGAAIAAAVLAHGAARVHALLLVLPAAQGVAVGLVAAWAARRVRMSHAAAAFAIAAVAGATALGGHALLDYRVARAAQVDQCDELQQVRFSLGASDDDALDRDHQACLDRMRLGGFFRLRLGLSPGGPMATDRGAALGSASGALALAVLEVMLASGIAGWLARSAAAEPACAHCGAWCVERALGRAAHGVGREVVDALVAGDTARATAALHPPDTREETRLAVLSCPAGHDEGGGIVRVEEHRIDRRQRMRRAHIADLTVDATELSALTGALDG